MSELRASFEAFHAVQDAPGLLQQACRYKKSLESLQVVGGIISQDDPAQVSAFDQLVKGAAVDGGVDVPASTVGDVTASMEFLDKLIKGVGQVLRRNDPKPGEHLGDKAVWSNEYKAAVTQLQSAIQKYYLNDSWLKKQIFVQGNISGDGISPYLTIGTTLYPDVEKALQAQKGVIDQYMSKYQPALDKWYTAIKQWDKEINEGLADVDDLDARLKKVLKEIRAMQSPTELAGLVGKTVELLGGYTVVFSKSGVITKEGKLPAAKELPALDAAGVKHAATLIIDLLNWGSSISKYFPDARYRGGVYNDDGKPSREFYDESAYMDDYYNLVDNHGFSDDWLYGLSSSYMIRNKLVVALDRWIDRSIK